MEAMDDPDSEVHEVQPKHPTILPPLSVRDAEAKASANEEGIDRTKTIQELADFWNRNGDLLANLSRQNSY